MPHSSLHVFFTTFIALLWPGLGLHFLGASHQQSCKTEPFEGHQKSHGLKLHGLQEIKSNGPPAPLDFANFDHGSAYEGLYVNEDARFAFCLIEKDGCTEWSAELAKLQENNPSINNPHYGLAEANWDEHAAKRVFMDPGAVRAVFVRDPLERFLSAYLNKCFAGNCSSPFCFMRDKHDDGAPVLFHRAVDWLAKVNVSTIDGHFRAQSQHCELYRRVHEYTHIGLYQFETFAHDSSCLLKKAGLEYLDTRDDWGSKQHFWDVGAPAGGNSHDQFSPTHEFLKRFYTPEAARKVYDIFKEDYDIFNIPMPRWIEDATGEFYDFVPKGACEQADSQFVSQGEPEKKDIDQISDIPTLAHLVGYSLDR